MFLGFREHLSLFTVSPATEKILSDGVEVAGIFSKFRKLWKPLFVFLPPRQWVCFSFYRLFS